MATSDDSGAAVVERAHGVEGVGGADGSSFDGCLRFF